MRFLIIPFFLFLFACADDERPAIAAPAVRADLPVVGLVLSPDGLGDMSYNDMQYNGLIEAYRHKEIEVRYRVPPVDTPQAITALCEEMLVREKCSLLLAGEGVRMTPIFNALARKYPAVTFALLGYCGDPLPNLVSSRFAQYEGSYVTGVLAGRMSATGRIAFIGGVDIPALGEFSAGFAAGVRRSLPKAALETRFISHYPDFSGFNNPQAGYRLARELYAEGVDVIYGAAGKSGNGIIQAARDAGRYVIGVDSNQDHMAPGFVLTSMMKRLDIAVVSIVERFLARTLAGGQAIIDFNYANGGVSTTDMAYAREKIPGWVQDETRMLEAVFAQGHVARRATDGK